MMGWWLAASLAWAVETTEEASEEASEQTTEASDVPLAIPVQEAPGASRRTEPVPRSQDEDGRPLALPSDASGRRAEPPPRASEQAWRTYERKELSVRPITEYSLRTVTVSSGWGWGPYWGGWGGYGWGPYWGGAYNVPVVDTRLGWAVFEGEHPLDVPSALDRLGATPQRVDLERRIRRARAASTAWTAVGVAGLVGGLVGVVGIDQSRSYDEARAWSAVATTSSLVGVGGLVVGTFPSAKARRLAVDPSWTISREEAEERADTANAAMRAEMGID